MKDKRRRRYRNLTTRKRSAREFFFVFIFCFFVFFCTREEREKYLSFSFPGRHLWPLIFFSLSCFCFYFRGIYKKKRGFEAGHCVALLSFFFCCQCIHTTIGFFVRLPRLPTLKPASMYVELWIFYSLSLFFFNLVQKKQKGFLLLQIKMVKEFTI